jgi:hypothetical protein
MEQKINVFAYAENVPEDINNLQTYVADSIDHIVADAIVATPRYAGFLAAKSGPAQVTLTVGRLYNSGKVYAKDTPTAYDFVAQLPVAAKRIVLISAWGSEVDTGATPRNVLIAAQSTPQNPVYQPQILEIVHARVANLGTSIGAEAPDPAPPVIDATLLPIAKVILTPTGVESVTNFSVNEVPTLADVEDRVIDLEAFEAAAAPQLASLASDIARLSNDLKRPDSSQLTGRMLGRLAVLEARNGIPSNAADSSADFFLDPANTDITNVNSNCKVAEGVRFADDGVAVTALQLFNPLNPLATIAGGVLFPAYDPALRFTTGPQSGATQISAYTYQTQNIVQKTMSRQRIRYGREFTVCTNSAFWRSGTYDPVSQTFTRNGETFSLSAADAQRAAQGHAFIRLKQFWTDIYQEPYWDVVTTTSSIAGASIYETFPVGQDFWLHSVGLLFTALDATGSVTIAICECETTGEGNLAKTLAQATLARSALQAAPAKTVFAFSKPVYMQAGKRYALSVITPGNHYIATASGPSFPQGMFFGVTGGYGVADPTKHIVADFHACKFRQTVTAIDLASLQLSGGITSIDILAAAIAPSSTALTYQVQLSGIWTSLNDVNIGNLNAGGALPPLLPFRAVFAGTQDIMPCLDLLTSQVKVARPKTSYTAIWPATARTPPAASASIRATIRFESFEAAWHTTAAKLLTGASYATETNPSSYTDVTTADGALERTYVWNLGAAVSSYKIKTTGTTTTPLITFHQAWIKDWVL